MPFPLRFVAVCVIVSLAMASCHHSKGHWTASSRHDQGRSSIRLRR